MSVTMSRADGVTVFTVTSDSESRWPPLCQIIKSLCYSPVCCSVSRHLRRMQRTSLSVLGALQIMIGLLNIGFGAILRFNYSARMYTIDSEFPFWLGALFILFGILCILSEKYPSPCLVILNVTLNLVGILFAITAIVLYCINTADIYIWWGECRERPYQPYYWSHYQSTTLSPSPDEKYLREKCLEGKALLLMLLRSINGVMIVLSVLELSVVISTVVLGIKALKSSSKTPDKSSENPELFKPLLEEVSSHSAA